MDERESMGVGNREQGCRWREKEEEEEEEGNSDLHVTASSFPIESIPPL